MLNDPFPIFYMALRDIGKYAAIGISALSIYEVGVMLIDQLGEYAEQCISKYIENRIKDTYEILCCLGK